MRGLNTIFFCILGINLFGQLNTELQSRVEYDQELSDVWGWTSSDGKEYALVGLTNGLSIVDLEDPKNPVKVAHVPGAFSYWRDIKTFGSYAYMVADQTGTKDGVMVIDLSGLPGAVTWEKWRPFAVTDTINRCHNLYIDENGYMFLSGCNVNQGGVIIADVDQPNGRPVFLKGGPSVYSHDVYVHEGLMFSSEIYGGKLSVYDFTNLNNINLVGQTSTPFNFTHNSWATEDGNYIFTTDEKANAPIAGYHIASLDQIEETAKFKPQYSINTGVIPHNVHVKNNYLFISYYTDGGVIVDALDPHNLIEVGNYDTEPSILNGFNGAWGLYPFFNSGNILISDINNGLFVVKPYLKRASRIKGKVKNNASGLPIFEAAVSIQGVNQSSKTDISGDYKSGVSESGSYLVTFSKTGYITQQHQVELTAGQEIEFDVFLSSSASCSPSSDFQSPMAKCKSNVFFSLEENPSGTLTPVLLDSASYDHCGSISFSASKTNFTCSNLGSQMVTLTVTDQSGNQSQCQSLVTVLNHLTETCNSTNLCSNLPLNSVLSGKINARGLIRAESQISSTNLIDSGSQIIYKAGNSIILEPGFEVKKGAQFSGAIESCTSPSPISVEKKQIDYIPGLRIFPNPSLGETRIEFPVNSENPTELLISDLSGRILEKQFLRGTGSGVEMKSIRYNFLKSGTFIIHLYHGDKVISSPLIVIKD